MTSTSLSLDNTTYQDDFETLQNKRILLQDGTTTNPSLSFVTDENTGLLRSNEDTLAFTTGGTTRLSINPTMITNAVTQSFVPGTVTDPGLATTTDSRTGIWSPVPGLLGFSSAGNNRMAIADQVITFVPIYMSDGTATDPSMSFNVDSNTGIYRPAADQIGITTGGTARLTVSNATAAILPTTASTTTTSGALVVAGGVGVAGNLNVGGVIGSSTISAFKTGSPSSTNIYYTPPTSIAYPYLGTYTKSYIARTGANGIFTFSNGPSFVTQIFQLTVSGGNQFVGSWAGAFMFSIAGSTPVISAITTLFTSNAAQIGAGSLTTSLSGSTLTLLFAPLTSPGNAADYLVCLTAYPSRPLGSDQMYTIQHV